MYLFILSGIKGKMVADLRGEDGADGARGDDVDDISSTDRPPPLGLQGRGKSKLVPLQRSLLDRIQSAPTASTLEKSDLLATLASCDAQTCMVFACVDAADQGTTGKSGRDATDGKAGGSGGDGGKLFVNAFSKSAAFLKENLVPVLSASNGGSGGDAGKPGRGGQGGEGADEDPFGACQRGQPGARGNDGASGKPGQQGAGGSKPTAIPGFLQIGVAYRVIE